MFNGKLGSLLPFDEAALPLVRAWINDEEVRRGTGRRARSLIGNIVGGTKLSWGTPAQRIFLVARGKGKRG